MKSSTIRRSNLSKEKIAVLEALSKFKNKNSISSSNNSLNSNSVNVEPQEDGTPEVYVRPNKEKELDILWQNFRMPKGERSPIVYLGIGFGAGVVITLIVSALIGLSASDFHPNFKFNLKMPSISMPAASSSSKLNFLPSSNSNSTDEDATSAEQKSDEEYTVQSGDTMEAIIRRFYGTYSTEKVNSVMKANNMTDPNKLSIGQKLVIPMSESDTGVIPTDETPSEE